MKILALILFTIVFKLSLWSQCPDKGFLWHRIIFLRDSSTVAPVKQLEELLGYQKKIDGCKYTNDSTNVLLLQRIGILYTKQLDYFTGILYTKKSIALVNQQKDNPAVNQAISIKSYRNLFMMYDSLKLETKKTEAIDSCISLSVQLGTGYDYALDAILLNLPRLFSIGDYFSCIKYATLAETVNNKLVTSVLENEEKNLPYFSWKINALTFLKQTPEARRLLFDKIRFAETNKKKKMAATYYGLYASVLREEGKASEAIDYYKKSFANNLRIGYQSGCAEALNNIGYTYSTLLHQNKRAVPYYFQALKFADANESLNILDNVANVYAHAGDYDSAFIFFQKAFDQLNPGFTEVNLLKNNPSTLPATMTEYVTGMVLDKAGAWFKKYKASADIGALKEAIRIYEITDRYFDKVKESQSEIQSKLFWKTNNRRLYENAIEACYEIQNKEKAFYFFEKSRAVLLNDQINEQRWMGDEDIARQAYIKKNITELEISLKTLPTSSPEYFTAQKKLYTSSQELVVLIRSIKDKNPAFYQNYLDTVFINLAQLQKNILNNSKTLIEIFSGDSAVYVLTIAPNNQSFIKIDKQLYDSLTNTFNSFVTNPAALNKNFTGFVTTAQQLYKLLFQNKIPIDGSIIISPDGINFPFEALVVNKDNLKPDYLLNHCATSYTYSVKYLTNQFTINPNKSNGVLGMAPVRYNNFKQLSVLSGSDNSLRNIKNYFSNTTNFTFDKATKSNFLQNFPDYAVIQLYTHASDSSINNDPVIYFADSALYLSGLIPNRKPVTQLVILSACETANGKLYKGEGVFSFNRGFAALGIPAAISNLWSVDNQSTYSVTELFYKYLSQGLPTDIALQKAKMEFISSSSSKEKKLPYFWAGAILTGKVDTIKSSNGISWTAIIIGGIILLCFSYFVGKVLLKKKKISDYFVEIP